MVRETLGHNGVQHPGGTAEATKTQTPLNGGRLLSSVIVRPFTWFIDGLVPHAQLTFVCGHPETGKSTFGAWLCAQARRPAILPGYEEDVEVQLAPRLVTAGLDTSSCLLLDRRLWVMPEDRELLTQVLKKHRTDLLWVDPVDSYLKLISENDPEGVRTGLESLCKVSRDVPCSVVAVRHPGKTGGNLCPGSRQWRAVPRMILELRLDPGPPETRYLRTDRDPDGRGRLTFKYTLEGEAGKPKLFRLGDRVGAREMDGTDLSDPLERKMIDEAEILIKGILGAGEMDSVTVYAMADKEKLRERTVRYAARRLGVVIDRRGSGKDHRSVWSLPDSGTPAVTPPPPPDTKSEGKK